MEVERLATGIEGLDELLGGGIPKGHVVLLTGQPGTMKSTMAFSVLGQHARRGGHGLYVTLEQSKRSLGQQMAAAGLGLEDLQGTLHVLDVAALQKGLGASAEEVWIEFLQRTIARRREVEGVDLLVLDSLEALEVLAKFTDRRTQLFAFFEWLRDLGCTSLVIAEAPPEQAPFWARDRGQADEAYLADGILHVKMHQINDVEVQRRIRCVKMRGANHKTGFFALVFEGGRFNVTRAMSL